MAGKEIEAGPTATNVAANVRRLRNSRGWNYVQLSDAMGDAGRPITPLAVRRVEETKRRVDVDDLVALAIALGVSPPALLMPSESTGDGVELTPSRSASTQAAWRWATGEQPLIEPGQLLYQLSSEVAEFRRQNRPYEGSRVDEATRTLITGNDQLAPAAAMRAEITVYVTSDGEVVGRPPRVSYFAAGDLFVDEDQEPDRGDD